MPGVLLRNAIARFPASSRQDQLKDGTVDHGRSSHTCPCQMACHGCTRKPSETTYGACGPLTSLSHRRNPPSPDADRHSPLSRYRGCVADSIAVGCCLHAGTKERGIYIIPLWSDASDDLKQLWLAPGPRLRVRYGPDLETGCWFSSAHHVSGDYASEVCPTSFASAVGDGKLAT